MRICNKTTRAIGAYLLIFCMAACMFLSVPSSYAWLFQNRQRLHTINSSNFLMYADVYFIQTDGTKVSAQNYRDSLTNYYLVDITNTASVNYASKLHVDIHYKGVTKAYLRVYIGDMWLANGKSIFKLDTKFNNTPDIWLDNRIYDNFYYYNAGTGEDKGKIFCDTLSEEKVIPLITTFTDFARITGGQLQLEIRAEAVQINRIEAFWGLSGIPG